jgi:CDP-diacylglycerol--glycerol-3-phosphate 3-phosphatidyltransferase
MNLANKLTLLRIALVPFLIFFMYLDNFWTRIIALFIFIVAAITDIYDGIIARRQKTVTTLGIFLDPLADKLIISAALISFVGLKELHIAAWMVVLIIAREFVITGLRTQAAAKGVSIPANKAGKFKTTSQIVTIITVMVILIIESALWQYADTTPNDLIRQGGGNALFGWCLEHLPFWLMLITTVLTLTSGFSYLKANRRILTE